MNHWLWVNEPIPGRYFEKAFAGLSLGNDALNATFSEAELVLVRYLRSLQYSLRRGRVASEVKWNERPRSELFHLG